MLPIMRRACEIVGGPKKLADAIGVKRQAFYQWPRVPADRVISIERATSGKVPRAELRPDLYPVEAAE